MTKNQHVTHHPDGGWQIKGSGNSRAKARTTTQSDDINTARDIARIPMATIRFLQKDKHQKHTCQSNKTPWIPGKPVTSRDRFILDSIVRKLH
jgi:hypothetical protein